MTKLHVIVLQTVHVYRHVLVVLSGIWCIQTTLTIVVCNGNRGIFQWDDTHVEKRIMWNVHIKGVDLGRFSIVIIPQ